MHRMLALVATSFFLCTAFPAIAQEPPAQSAPSGEKAAARNLFAVEDRLHAGFGLGYASGEGTDDFATRLQFWWDVVPYLGLETEWITAAGDHGFNFALAPKIPFGNFTVLAKVGAFVLGTGGAGQDSGDVAHSYGAGFTYVFGEGPFGIRTEWTGIGDKAKVNVATFGGFLRW